MASLEHTLNLALKARLRLVHQPASVQASWDLMGLFRGVDTVCVPWRGCGSALFILFFEFLVYSLSQNKHLKLQE